MKFLSFDKSASVENETEVIVADRKISQVFVTTWVTAHMMNMLKNYPGYNYDIFPWDKIINSSYVVGESRRCYAAITENRLDGLISLNSNGKFEVEFISTAPWNYYLIAKIKGIGEGLILHTIIESNYCGFEGQFYLKALPDAEPFYEKIGMKRTGLISKEGLKEFHMSKEASLTYQNRLKERLIK